MKLHCLAKIAVILTVITCCHPGLLSQACPVECSCSPASQSIICNAVSNAFNSYVSSIPAWVSRIILVCQPQLNSAGRPVPAGPSLSVFSPGLLRRFGELREFSIRSCPIANLPAETFAYLSQLESVTLDNLPLTSLQPGIFRGSRKLRDLVIIRSPEYRLQPRGLFVENPGLRQIRLVETGLNGEAVANLLASAGSLNPAMVDLEIKVTANPPLTLEKDAFNRFNLSHLSLSTNGIISFDFLAGVGAASVTLSYNPVPSGRLSLLPVGSKPTPNYLVTSLHLEHMGLYEIPEGLAAIFPNLAELHAAANVISELAPERLENLSKLVKIDLSGNQIQSLSNRIRLRPLLSEILYRDRVAGQVYIADNPVHCNCELAWVYDTPMVSNSLFKDLACRTGQFQGQPLARVQKHQLMCQRQQAPAVSTVGGNGTRNFTEYEVLPVLISEGENVTLTCSSSGDPAPSLNWRFLNTEGPPQELVRSKPNKDYAAQRSELVLVVAHGKVPPGRHRFQCAATSPYNDERRVNATLIVAVATTTPSRGLAGSPGPSIGRSDLLQHSGKAIWLTVACFYLLTASNFIAN